MILNIEELDDYLLECLVELGYAPTTEEIEDISDIVIQFFMQKGIARGEEEGEM